MNITDILNIESQINVIKDEKRREKEKILQMQQDETAHKEMWAQKERELSLKLIDEERDFANLIAKRDATHAIKSPISGRILSIHKNVGDKVLVNDIVMTMGKGDDNNLEALLYFNPLEGKEMKENARVYMIPTYLEKEHRGFMEGRIMHISPYPETARSLMKALQNEELVKKFTETNPPISARVSLDRVSMVSSLLSPLTPGTWLYARVVVHQSSALALIIPELKKLLEMQQ
ncbi:MAG: HlyD family secretion protein [Alphaproteobacteria bacterium]|nr:HlyD family secretion protein [Alphaproteobacteria bacterium]